MALYLVVPDVGSISEVVHYVLKCVTEALAIPDEQLGLHVLGIVNVRQNPSASGLVGMNFAEGL
jgi:hypothetical protein